MHRLPNIKSLYPGRGDQEAHQERGGRGVRGGGGGLGREDESTGKIFAFVNGI